MPDPSRIAVLAAYRRGQAAALRRGEIQAIRDIGCVALIDAERSRIRNAVERAAFGSPRCVELHALLAIIEGRG